MGGGGVNRGFTVTMKSFLSLATFASEHVWSVTVCSFPVANSNCTVLLSIDLCSHDEQTDEADVLPLLPKALFSSKNTFMDK